MIHSTYATVQNSPCVLAKGLIFVLCLACFVSAIAIDKDQVASQRSSSIFHVSSRNSSGLASDSVPQSKIVKREDNARFTFYETGLGACGGWNNPTDFIVALNGEQWDGGSHCWDWITMEYNGKTTKAQIVDECPSCPWGGLDLSPGLFSFLENPGLGVIYGSWKYGAEEPPAPAPSPSPPPPPPPSPSPPPPSPSPDPTPESQPQPQPQTEQQQQPQTPSPPSPSEAPTQTSSTSVSIISTSSTAPTTSTTSTTLLQTNTLLVPRPSPGAASNGGANSSDTGDDDATLDDGEPLFQYEAEDEPSESEVNNLQKFNLAMVNLALLRSHTAKHSFNKKVA